MQMKGRATVVGATQVAFKSDDGEQVDAQSLFVLVDLDKKWGGIGQRSEPRRAAPGVIDKIKHSPFPFEADVTLEELATKGKTSLVIVECVPVKMAARAA